MNAPIVTAPTVHFWQIFLGVSMIALTIVFLAAVIGYFIEAIDDEDWKTFILSGLSLIAASMTASVAAWDFYVLANIHA